MPSLVSILCHIKYKGLDGGFFNGLASYMVESNVSKIFYYGYYKKQISSFLCDLNVNDYVLVCGKCVFSNKNIIYVSIAKYLSYFILFYFLEMPIGNAFRSH